MNLAADLRLDPTLAADPRLRAALAAGSERVAAWADLLDRINVFPVADGDTGRNLVLSLQPLRDTGRSAQELIEALLLAARGNSGNIAAQFFQGLLAGEDAGDLAGAVHRGRELAWRAVAEPRRGTMLTLFDSLAAGLAPEGEPEVPPRGGEGTGAAGLERLLDRLEQAVLDSPGQLAELERAGVVDAGALGMYIFFDAFLHHLAGAPDQLRSIADRFRGTLEVGAGFQGRSEQGFCIDAVVRAEQAPALVAELRSMGESVVTMQRGDLVKVHLHADDPDRVRGRLQQRADLLRFASDDMQQQAAGFLAPADSGAIHVMTDAAGSLTAADARRLRMSLLASYVHIGPLAMPEIHVQPEELYAAMRRGESVSTSQASVYERHQHYRKALGMHRRVLYICVGSVFTGNHETAAAWKRAADEDDRLCLIDTGAASGRLALIALAAAEHARRVDDPDAVVRMARWAVAASREWIFLDQLKWLAAGGRLSKPGAFFGDLFHVKPVVSPTPEGAKKVGVVRNRQAQLEFAFARLDAAHTADGPGRVLIEYTDNRDWVAAEVAPQCEQRYGGSEVLLQPMGLTSGAHMGPGTWAVAYLPRPGQEEDGR